jgi:hypothetical protein
VFAAISAPASEGLLADASGPGAAGKSCAELGASSRSVHALGGGGGRLTVELTSASGAAKLEAPLTEYVVSSFFPDGMKPGAQGGGGGDPFVCSC